MEENLLETRSYIRQLSKEELLQNFYLIEQLRSSYIKQIEEVIKNDSDEEQPERFDSPKASKEERKHDVTVYRDELSGEDPLDIEFGINLLPEGEQDYIVEAYNKAGSELVISDLKIDHQSSYLPSIPETSVLDGQGIRRYGSEKSDASSVFFDEENTTILEDVKSNQDYSCEDDEDDSSAYMSLSDCMSGMSLQSNKGYEYFGEVPMRIKSREGHQSPNLKIQIGVEVFHDNNQYKSRRETLYDRDSNPRIEKVSLIPEKNGFHFSKSPTEKYVYLLWEVGPNVVNF